jgi:hypothetical protein
MTPPPLQLPYAIWTSLAGAGLVWIANLSPTDTENAPEYRVRIQRVLKSKKPQHDLLFCHDGEQYRVFEATNNFPTRLYNSLDWRLQIEVHLKEAFDEITEKSG